MSVILRCSNCGTTQGHEGECEACSEGEVRYFCANHGQGIWLDGPMCSRCGAKFGDAPRTPVTAAPPPPPPVPAGRAGAPDFRPPARRRTPERSPAPDFGWRTDPHEPPDPDTAPRTPTLGELLEEMTEARARRPVPLEVEGTPSAGAPWRSIGVPLAGCLMRILGFGFLLFVAFVVFLFLLFGGLIGG